MKARIEKELEKYINVNKLNENIYLKGFCLNPFKFISKSFLYISSSKWEEPGHSILEIIKNKGYLNLPIITSDCLMVQKNYIFTKKMRLFLKIIQQRKSTFVEN